MKSNLCEKYDCSLKLAQLYKYEEFEQHKYLQILFQVSH